MSSLDSACDIDDPLAQFSGGFGVIGHKDIFDVDLTDPAAVLTDESGGIQTAPGEPAGRALSEGKEAPQAAFPSWGFPPRLSRCPQTCHLIHLLIKILL